MSNNIEDKIKKINTQERNIIRNIDIDADVEDIKSDGNFEDTGELPFNPRVSRKIPEEFYEKKDDEVAAVKKRDRKEKKKRKIGAYNVVVTVLALIFMFTSVFLYSKLDKNEVEMMYVEKKIESEDEGIKGVIKDYMENGKGVMEMLRKIFPNDIVVFNSKSYSFFPVAENVPKNNIDNSNIKKMENGELRYVIDGEVKSYKGIDVSKFQEDIDWEKVAADGVQFAMIRVGARGYGTGEIVHDKYAEQNIEGALNAGIKVGVYFFSQAITEEEAVEEAEFVLDIIKNYDIKYPVVFDTEDVPEADIRTEVLSKDELTDITIKFCETIKKAGYTPAVYANLRWFALSLDIERLADYEKWYAYYDNDLYFPYEISMWQYSETGTVDGVKGKVDMNISFKDYN